MKQNKLHSLSIFTFRFAGSGQIVFIFALWVCILTCSSVIGLSTTIAADYSALDSSWVETVYSLLRNNRTESAAEYIKSLGDENTVIRIWLDIQHDIFNVKDDARASALIGRIGAEYAAEKGYQRTAAVMLHNICSFLMPNFDEGVDSEVLPIVIEAGRRQVELRREIRHKSRLVWALWDLGLAELAADHATEAIEALSEGEKLALDNGEMKASAWCRIFKGKAMVKYKPELEFEGARDMLEAAKVIRETGETLEKEAVSKILKSVWLE